MLPVTGFNGIDPQDLVAILERWALPVAAAEYPAIDCPVRQL